MGHLPIPLQFARFEIENAAAKNAENLAAGLFFLWTPVDAEETQPNNPSRVELAFCSRFGTAHDVRNVKNPWFLVADSTRNAGVNAGAPPLQFGKQTYLLLLVAHPSKAVAERQLARARDGEALPFRRVTPVVKDGTLVFKVSDEPSAYVPGGGAARYNSFLLYRGMPYAGVGAVKDAVKQLAVDLGNARYPTADGTNHRMYAETAADHDGSFDLPMQASLHHFQQDLSNKTAFSLTRSFVSKGHPSWDFTHAIPATPAQFKAPPVAPEDIGVAEQKTADALVEWAAVGLRHAGRILVKSVRERTARPPDNLWALPDLWFRHWALEALCLSLGAQYSPVVGSTSRYLGTAGAGQSVQSKHKVGMALDLEANIPEPTSAVPFAYEADFVQEKSTFRPRWLLYMRSTLDPNAPVPKDRLGTVQGSVRDRMLAHLGPALPPEAESFLVALQAFIGTLLARISAPSTTGLGSGFADDFLRTTIRRFQWRTNVDGGGNAMPEVTAAADASANGLVRPKPTRSWLNLGRLAFGVGLDSIGAREDFQRSGATDPKGGGFILVRPSNSATDAAKASDLDRIADAIQSDADRNAIKLFGPDDPKMPIAAVPPSFINEDILSGWIRRPSDGTDGLPGASSSIGLEYAREKRKGKKVVDHNGIDLRVTVLFNSAGALAQEKFFEARSSLPVRVVSVGAGLNIKLPIGLVTTMSGVRAAMVDATPIVPIVGEDVNVIRLRPVLVRELDPALDPGRVFYQVKGLAEPKSLEWWHIELPYGAPNWIEHADAVGFSSAVLVAPAVPAPDEEGGPVFRGGAGVTKAQHYERPSEPLNQPRRPVSAVPPGGGPTASPIAAPGRVEP